MSYPTEDTVQRIQRDALTLARRDQFAAAALTGLLVRGHSIHADDVASDAASYADALLAALDGTEGA